MERKTTDAVLHPLLLEQNLETLESLEETKEHMKELKNLISRKHDAEHKNNEFRERLDKASQFVDGWSYRQNRWKELANNELLLFQRIVDSKFEFDCWVWQTIQFWLSWIRLELRSISLTTTTTFVSLFQRAQKRIQKIEHESQLADTIAKTVIQKYLAHVLFYAKQLNIPSFNESQQLIECCEQFTAWQLSAEKYQEKQGIVMENTVNNLFIVKWEDLLKTLRNGKEIERYLETVVRLQGIVPSRSATENAELTWTDLKDRWRCYLLKMCK